MTQTTASMPDELARRHRAAVLIVVAMLVLTVAMIVLALAGVHPFIEPSPMLHMGLRISIIVFILGAAVLRRTRFASARLRDIASVKGIPALLASLQKTTVLVALLGGAIAVMGYVLSTISQSRSLVMLVVGVAALVVLLSCYPRRAAWERVVGDVQTMDDEGLPPSKGTIA